MSVEPLAQPPWLDSEAAMRVLALLDCGGEEARVVGGAVRDALLRVPCSEIDIATTATPDEVVRRAKAAGIKAVPTGIEHGTVTLVVDSVPFEVTTLREDVETFGRKARVAFGRDFERDARRRDFTINGLSWSRDGLVHDHVGGLADIAARRVRFIGDPDVRIAEDYLRILRFFRFHARYGEGTPDRAAHDACVRGHAGLRQLSAERVRAELLKLLVAPRAAEALEAMSGAGLLNVLLCSVTYLPIFRRMVQAEDVLAEQADPLRRLAALAAAVPEDAERLGRRLRLSRAESKRLAAMTQDWWRLAGSDETGRRRVLYAAGPQAYRDRAMLAWARKGGDIEDLTSVCSLPERWSAPRFPLAAKDFIARGFIEGPALGHVLAQAERRWIEAGFPLDVATMVAIADETAATFRQQHRL